MSSNREKNKKALDAYRDQLNAMFEDIRDIDIKVLNKAVNKGVKVAKQNTNVVSGFMHKAWRSAPAVKSRSGGVTKNMVNSADYSSYVNYGHRIVETSPYITKVDGTRMTYTAKRKGTGNTIGFVKGQFMLEKAIKATEYELSKEFKKEVERVNREHGK